MRQKLVKVGKSLQKSAKVGQKLPKMVRQKLLGPVLDWLFAFLDCLLGFLATFLPFRPQFSVNKW